MEKDNTIKNIVAINNKRTVNIYLKQKSGKTDVNNTDYWAAFSNLF